MRKHGGYPLSVVPGYYGSKPGIQIGTQAPCTMSEEAGIHAGSRLSLTTSEEELQFVRQLGVEWVMTSLDDPREHTLENYLALKKRFESHGLKIYRLANHSVHNMEEVTLNLPGRDAKIEEYLTYIRNLGAAGIHYATYAHMGNGIWSTGRERIRGGATGRAFHIQQAKMGRWIDKTWEGPLTHGRRYSEDEIWDNYIYFIERVAPVAEEAGVYIGIHPDDPPGYDLGGVPRCIFSSFDGYKRALEIAGSPNIGMCLCVGCWLEGGERMGKDVIETIRYFGSQKKIFKVHLRNVDAPMPQGFVETYLDEGRGDMYRVIRTLHEVGFDGAVISDHLPRMVGGRRAAEAYAIGYITALLQAVNADGARPRGY